MDADCATKLSRFVRHLTFRTIALEVIRGYVDADVGGSTRGRAIRDFAEDGERTTAAATEACWDVMHKHLWTKYTETALVLGALRSSDLVLAKAVAAAMAMGGALSCVRILIRVRDRVAGKLLPLE